MHKVWFEIYTRDEWYTIIRECKKWFGNNWRGQRGVRRRLEVYGSFFQPHKVWFLVPNPEFKTWYELKYTDNKNSGR